MTVIPFPLALREPPAAPLTIPPVPAMSRFRVTLTTGEMRVIRAANAFEAPLAARHQIPDLAWPGVAIARVVWLGNV